MDKQMSKIGGGILLVLAVVAYLTFVFVSPSSFRGTSYEKPYPVAPDIRLTKADGSTFLLSDQRGKIVLLFFGYTSCPDVCPTTMAEMKQVMLGLGKKAENVQVVFISVDPDRDTPERIKAYAENFYPTFLGLTGTKTELEHVWINYSIIREEVQSDSAFGVIINHTARVLLIDQDGNMRLSYAYQTPVEDVIHDVNLLLK